MTSDPHALILKILRDHGCAPESDAEARIVVGEILAVRDGGDLPELTYVVEYRGIYQDNGSWPSPHNWKPMAAFDGELAAERYATKNARGNTTWAYRATERRVRERVKGET